MRQPGVHSSDAGIVLREGSDDNKVDGNRIYGVQSAGIAIVGDNSGNQVHGNRVTCASEATFQAVDASPAAREANQISGNKLAK
jgi:parallel beta-helix repeat protein